MSAIAICSLGVVVVMGTILVLRQHAFLALILGAFLVALLTPEAALHAYGEERGLPGIAEQSASARVANGFADGCGKIAILIALAAVIGQCLLVSGAAEQIVRKIRAFFGEKRTPLAFLGSGFTLGIPVFFDTVFYLLIPLVRAFARHNPSLFLLSVLSVVAGASMAHSLVPPTPGPLLVAASLDVGLGTMIPAGFILGLITISAGYLYAKWANATFTIPMRLDEALTGTEESVEDRALPPLWFALLPVAVPLLFISGGTVTDLMGWTLAPIELLSDKNVAIGIGAILALVMACRYREGTTPLRETVQDALRSGGVIILITAGGAAFGEVLRQTGIAGQLAAYFPQTGGAILVIAFFLTALVRFAQGSATVAMITAVGIVAPLAEQVDLGFHPVYVALAIGCGSKPFPWMNDSGFWVVGRMSGMTESETLKTFSAMLTIMGLVGFAVVYVASVLLPLQA